LFHGTVGRFMESIKNAGLKRGSRHHVHLSADKATATSVGSRRGHAVLLIVKAKEMTQDGHDFFVSANGVWLTEHVPSKYIDFASTEWPGKTICGCVNGGAFCPLCYPGVK
jgi:putative RNA 2'-phosphotransferase